tara:strand:+ start:29 stop:439 length:411 start_codon:yes stop_codon:yes gene_type:complete
LINFTIPGIPKPLKRHRSTRSGHIYDPSAKDKKGIWLQIAKYKPKTPLKGDIYLKTIFYMPYKKYMYRTGKYSHLLKDNYKIMNYHSYKPDLDNLVKMIADIIQPQMICDDSQICMLQAEKIYGEPRTEVTIQEIS